jgi:DNA polymerase-3 subunit alpha
MVVGYTLYIQGKCAPRFQNSTFLSFQLSNVQFMSKAKDENIEKFTIMFDSSLVDEAMVTDLSTLISEHPGTIQLYFAIKNPDSPAPLILHSRNHTIDVNRELLSYIDNNPNLEYHIN